MDFQSLFVLLWCFDHEDLILIVQMILADKLNNNNLTKAENSLPINPG
jgi:hypothetical protein